MDPGLHSFGKSGQYQIVRRALHAGLRWWFKPCSPSMLVDLKAMTGSCPSDLMKQGL